jgi:hypothetical protein
MSNKPYATDWVTLHPGVEYSIQLNLYWSNNRVYDELSASHNGIIGPGHRAKEIIKCHNKHARH